MHHNIFAGIWLAFALLVYFWRRQEEPVGPWFYTAIICSSIWSATR